MLYHRLPTRGQSAIGSWLSAVEGAGVAGGEHREGRLTELLQQGRRLEPDEGSERLRRGVTIASTDASSSHRHPSLASAYPALREQIAADAEQALAVSAADEQQRQAHLDRAPHTAPPPRSC
jgi:hypothetical protein